MVGRPSGAPTQAADPLTGRSWLVVGHGSVGSWLARRIATQTDRLLIYDPAPRVEVQVGTWLPEITESSEAADYIVSCVPPASAELIPRLVAQFTSPATVLFEWNSASPEVKARIAATTACRVIDVALLDSLDRIGGHPVVAVSGLGAQEIVPVLEEIGFHVDVVGQRCGEAALLKFVRSSFMKSLEALLLEYYALAASLDPDGVVTASITRNLGDQFSDFTRLLLKTNRLHARRRARELADAVEVLGRKNGTLAIAIAAVATLERSALAWETPDAPPEDAPLVDLVAHLKNTL